MFMYNNNYNIFKSSNRRLRESLGDYEIEMYTCMGKWKSDPNLTPRGLNRLFRSFKHLLYPTDHIYVDALYGGGSVDIRPEKLLIVAIKKEPHKEEENAIFKEKLDSLIMTPSEADLSRDSSKLLENLKRFSEFSAN